MVVLQGGWCGPVRRVWWSCEEGVVVEGVVVL